MVDHSWASVRGLLALALIFMAHSPRVSFGAVDGVLPSADDGPPVTPTAVGPRDGQAPQSGQLSAMAIITDTPQAIAAAMGIRATDVISASFNGSDPRGLGIGTSPLGRFFPTEGNSMAILSTGQASSADDPNTSSNLSSVLDGMNNSQGNDKVQLALRLKVPDNSNCASFDFAYFSEEFPEYVNSVYNDTFTAELGGTNLTITNTQVIAPLNFAFDIQDHIISINTVFGITNTTATTYDGTTSLLRAQTPVTPGAAIDLVFTVQDLGDSIFDSAVLLDKFFWSADAGCGAGAQADSDGDGLLDLWETQGLTVTVAGADVFVDLPTMGASVNRKDIFVEIDYMEDPGFCVAGSTCVFGHSHKPKAAAIAKVIQAFANAPVPNPDGSLGIDLHVDFGSETVMDPATGELWGTRSNAEALREVDGLGETSGNNYVWSAFDELRTDHFSPARAAVFHYAIFAHNLGGLGSVSGISRGLGASDFIVSLGSWTSGVGTVNEQAGTFMHELGHNLGLRHGGDATGEHEPNFLSVMNYSFQTRGLRISGQDGHFDYSRVALPDLVEASLNEAVGLNGGTILANYGTRYFCSQGGDRTVNDVNAAIDWNCNGSSADTAVQTDVNKDGQQTTLRGYNDWANLVFTGGALGQPGAQPDLPAQSLADETDFVQDSALTSDYRVVILAPGHAAAVPGYQVNYTITVANQGVLADTYTFTVANTLGWVDLTSFPSTLTLSPGQSATYSVSATVPPSATPAQVDELTLAVRSHSNALVDDTAVTTTGVLRQMYLPTLRK